jgi:hypothetical protein
MDGAFREHHKLAPVLHLETLRLAGKAGIQLPCKTSIRSTPVLRQIAQRGVGRDTCCLATVDAYSHGIP